MSLADRINNDIKEAMKAKDKERLESLRAIKSAILMAATEKGAGDGMSEEAEIKLLSKLVKTRKDSGELYRNQGREDLAEVEFKQADIIEVYLPKMLSDDELKVMVNEALVACQAKNLGDMGKVIGLVVKMAAGKADGKQISDMVKNSLASMS